MAVIPLWYRLILEFNYVFHSVVDLLFIVLAFLIIGAVSRPGWQHHLRWASPLAAASVLTGCYRLTADLRHYLHVVSPAVYVASDLLLYLADGASLYGTWMLWRTLSALSRHSVSPDPLVQHPPQPGVWPPPPTFKQ